MHTEYIKRLELCVGGGGGRDSDSKSLPGLITEAGERAARQANAVAELRAGTAGFAQISLQGSVPLQPPHRGGPV